MRRNGESGREEVRRKGEGGGGGLHSPFPGPSWSWCGGVTLARH